MNRWLMIRGILVCAACVFCPVLSAMAEDVVTDQIDVSRVVVNFEPDSEIFVSPGKLKGRIVPTGSGHSLELKGEAGAGYPSIAITQPSGKWDLGTYDTILMDVRNLASTPVRVLLSLNNPGADGRKHCNTESVTVPAGSKGVLSVPYGMWHGDRDRFIDRSNIISLQVLLDHPRTPSHFRVDNIRAVTYKRMVATDLHDSPFFRSLEPFFGRGINLGNALDAPTEGAWGVTLDASYFSIIRKAGFDTVRIPVRWSAHAELAPPYRIDPVFFERVEWAVRSASEQRLNVVLNMHHYNEYFEDVRTHEPRFLALWKQIAERFRDAPESVCFELLNEPHGNLSSIDWNRAAIHALKEIRKSNPDRWIMIGPTQFNSISRLDELELPATDRKIVVTIHYYSPHRFTHQGASWAGDMVKSLKDVRWLGSRKEREAVSRDLDEAMTWGILNRRPIFLGEFGAYSPARMEDRARWTRSVAREAAKRKMGSAYWEFCAGFGAYDPDANQWRSPLLKALIW